MKNLFKILIPIFLLSFLFSEKQIKTNKEYYYKIEQKFGENIDSLIAFGVSEYNLDNNIIGGSIYSTPKKENLLIKRKCKYDSNNNLIEIDQYSSDGNLLDKYIYKYDLDYNLIEELLYSSDGFLMEKINKHKYDSNNNLIESLYTSFDIEVENRQIEEKIYYKYDSNNNLIEESFYNYDGKFTGKTIHKYDSHNNNIEMLKYNIENKFGRNEETLINKVVVDYEYYD